MFWHALALVDWYHSDYRFRQLDALTSQPFLVRLNGAHVQGSGVVEARRRKNSLRALVAARILGSEAPDFAFGCVRQERSPFAIFILNQERQIVPH
jgi:hypothetical protein